MADYQQKTIGAAEGGADGFFMKHAVSVSLDGHTSIMLIALVVPVSPAAFALYV